MTPTEPEKKVPDDVRKTVSLLKYGIDNGCVFYLNKDRKKVRLEIDWRYKLRNIEIKVHRPECLGGYKTAKEGWQCGRCHSKILCKDMIKDEN